MPSRKIKTTAAKPATAKPATAKPAVPAVIVAKPSISDNQLKRDAATITALRTSYGNLSARDDAYLAFYRKAAGKTNVVTLATMRAAATDTGRNPFYTGSGKATDAGATVRLIKAGMLTETATGEYAFTADGAKQATRAHNAATGTATPAKA